MLPVQTYSFRLWDNKPSWGFLRKENCKASAEPSGTLLVIQFKLSPSACMEKFLVWAFCTKAMAKIVEGSATLCGCNDPSILPVGKGSQGETTASQKGAGCSVRQPCLLAWLHNSPLACFIHRARMYLRPSTRRTWPSGCCWDAAPVQMPRRT